MTELSHPPNTFDSSSPNRWYGQGPSKASWAANEGGTQTLFEAVNPAEFMWRIEAHGVNAQFRLLWGKASNLLESILSPMVAYVPQTFLLEGSQIDPTQPATAAATLTAVDGDAEGYITTLVSAAGLLPATGRRAYLLAATTLDIAGTAIAFPAAGTLVDLAAPTSLVAGGPILVHHAT